MIHEDSAVAPDKITEAFSATRFENIHVIVFYAARPRLPDSEHVHMQLLLLPGLIYENAPENFTI